MQIGASVYELPDGERTYPYHFHNAMEEWLVVLDGTPTLREPGGSECSGGATWCASRPGPEGAHQVRGPGTVMILSANRAPEVNVYPDSGKVGVRPRKLSDDDSVDYWEGE